MRVLHVLASCSSDAVERWGSIQGWAGKPRACAHLTAPQGTSEGKIQAHDIAHPNLLMHESHNICRDVVFQRLVESRHT